MQLAHPTTLSEALELAIEREILGSEMDADVMMPIVRALEMTKSRSGHPHGWIILQML